MQRFQLDEVKYNFFYKNVFFQQLSAYFRSEARFATCFACLANWA